MANGDSTPDVQSILADDNFKSLPIGEKHQVLRKVDPNYSALPPREQAHALSVIHYGKDQVDPDPPAGSELWRTVKGVGRGLNNAVEATYQTIVHPINTASAIASQVEDMPGKFAAASKETDPVSEAADYGAAIPVLGPLGKQLGERAASGDVAGAIAEGVTTAAAPSLARELAGRGVPEKYRATAKAVARDVAQKYVGKTAADAILPPPPEPPVNVEAEAAKQVAKEKAVRTAREKAGLRRPQSEIDAERATKTQNAAYQKDAEERMAIQKRADDAESARMQAEKEAKNARLKSDASHAQELADAEKARQNEITAQAKVRQIQDQMDAADKAKDAESLKSLKSQMAEAEKSASDAAAQKERLRTQHGDDLMRRQKEQDALDKASESAAKEEESAKKEVTKRAATSAKASVTRPGDSGTRPTETEMTLTRLFKKRVWTPTDEVDARNALGPDAVRRPNEGFAKYQARVMGMIRSSRAAIGMHDIESGPAGLPPPPAP